jgi:leucyl-tRNA synthetase
MVQKSKGHLEKDRNTFVLSFPCVYPVCPLSIDHARMYLIGDIFARYSRSCHKKVLFPIGFHCSGNTAQKFCRELNSDGPNSTKQMFAKIYHCSSQEINYFKKSGLNILNFYIYKTLQELKQINVTANYEEYYTTLSKQFNTFIRILFGEYKKKKVLIPKKDNLQLDYNNKKWKDSVISNIKNISAIVPNQNKCLAGAINDLKNGWNILKNEGLGVTWEDGRIIDSMHDSELLSLYDLINHISKIKGEFTQDEMIELFKALSGNSLAKISDKVSQVISLLPTSLLIIEEHLKVWLIKKIYAEELLYSAKYRTKKFCVQGLGMKNNQRMSSSQGTAILLKDLISNKGPIKTRIIMIITSSNISNFYNYNDSIIIEADRLLSRFKSFITLALAELSEKINLRDFLKENYREDILNTIKQEELVSTFYTLEQHIKDGSFKQCLIEILRVIPKKYKNYSIENKQQILYILNYFINILLGVTIVEI